MWAALLRPARLHEARAEGQEKRLSAAELRAIEDECIRDAVALQEAPGISAVTDGEFPARHYLVDFLTAFSGIVPTQTSYALAFKGDDGASGETRSMLTVTSKVKRTRPVMVEDFSF
jgi:5-methyltetrahydropteroyltriglutamate--homocysteine methyltransferase